MKFMLMAALWLALSACGPAATPTASPAAGDAPALPRAVPPSPIATTPAAPTATPTLVISAAGMPFLLPNVARAPAGTAVPAATAAPALVGGEPVRIVIPSIRVDSPVVPVAWTTVFEDNEFVVDWDTADFAVGYHETSALPGAVGNTVMSGHNNIKGEVFRYLDQVKVRDTITVYTADQRRFQYTVTQAMIVPDKFASLEQRLKNAAWIGPTDDNRLTLISCWPYSNNTHRVIVVAQPS